MPLRLICSLFLTHDFSLLCKYWMWWLWELRVSEGVYHPQAYFNVHVFNPLADKNCPILLPADFSLMNKLWIDFWCYKFYYDLIFKGHVPLIFKGHVFSTHFSENNIRQPDIKVHFSYSNLLHFSHFSHTVFIKPLKKQFSSFIISKAHISNNRTPVISCHNRSI